MISLEQWFAPGYVVGEDRPLLIYPAAGWIHRSQRVAYGAPGYLVQNPAEQSPPLIGQLAYYVPMPDGRFVWAWAERIQALKMDQRGISLLPIEGIQRAGEHWVDVVRHLDDTGLGVYGYTIRKYVLDPAEVEERLASLELQQLIDSLESRWRRQA